MNKRNILIVLGVTIISLSLIGLSYAFYLADIDNSNNTKISISSGDLELELKDTDTINIDNAKPGSFAEKTFTVENHGLKTFYNIKFTDIENTFVNEDLQYTLTRTDGSEQQIAQGFINDTTVKTGDGGTKYLYIKTEIDIEPNPTIHTYKLKLEFLNKPKEDQNDNQGAIFKGRINIDQEEVTGKQQESTFLAKLEEAKEAGQAEYDDFNNLRYIGADPANYIWFNCDDYNGITEDNAESEKHCEKWRIIGVMKNVEKEDGSQEDLIKIVRADSIGNYSWDNKNTSTGAESAYGKNDWTTAELMYLLNPNYGDHQLNSVTANNSLYWNHDSGNCSSGQNNTTTTCDFRSTGLKGDDSGPTKSMIESVKWNLGGAANGQMTASAFYTAERGTTAYTGRPTTWTGKVGLIYPSDYGYATAGGTKKTRQECLAYQLYNWSSGDYQTDCANNSWLKPSSGYLWTLTPRSVYSDYVFVVGSAGFVDYSTAYSASGVSPSLYLTSDVGIKEGVGTGEAEHPYILEVAG